MKNKQQKRVKDLFFLTFLFLLIFIFVSAIFFAYQAGKIMMLTETLQQLQHICMNKVNQ